MDTPTAFLLDAARRAASVISAGPASAAARGAAYAALPTGGIYGVDDLKRGEALLVTAGLASVSAGDLIPNDGLVELAELAPDMASEMLLACWLSHREPVWLTLSAASGHFHDELIPTNELAALANVVPDPARREALLLAAGRRFDRDVTEAIGAAGEEAVIDSARSALNDMGRSDLARQVQRVSLISDQLGYDVVAPTTHDTVWRIEVKTAKPGRRLRVILSRNEAEVGRRDPSWALVVCQITAQSATIVGWAPASLFAERLPSDIGPGCRWNAVEMLIDPAELATGLPPVV